MDAIDFGYATEVVRKSQKAKRRRQHGYGMFAGGRRTDSEGRPLRKSSKKEKVAKLAVFGLIFGGFGS
jgi:hypothetical protein